MREKSSVKASKVVETKQPKGKGTPEVPQKTPRTRRTKAEMEEARAKEAQTPPVPKRKRRTKAEMEAAKVVVPVVVKPTPVVVSPPPAKRTRRTQAEMAAARGEVKPPAPAPVKVAPPAPIDAIATHPIIQAAAWIEKNMSTQELEHYRRRANRREIPLKLAMAMDVLSIFSIPADADIRKQIKTLFKL